jgi:hypothetical protein
MSHDEDDADLRAAMEASSSPPESPTPDTHNATKRFHSSISDDYDSSPDIQVADGGHVPSSQFSSPDPSLLSTVSVNKNIAHHAKQYASRKKLKTEQLAEVDVFLTVRSFHSPFFLTHLMAVVLGYS